MAKYNIEVKKIKMSSLALSMQVEDINMPVFRADVIPFKLGCSIYSFTCTTEEGARKGAQEWLELFECYS